MSGVPARLKSIPVLLSKMETLRHIFLEMNSDERHLLVRDRDILLRVLRIGEIVQRHRAPSRRAADRIA